jgi:predicted RND superfamily exporter protein
MIGLVMLLGIVTKNSILLVDFALEGVRAGLNRKEAIYRAGLIRLRPILMTTVAMIAGTLPVALGAGEAAKYRTGLGVGVIGGLILSTILTLVVVPAIFDYIDRLREWIESKFRPAADNVIQGDELSVSEIMKVHFHDGKIEHHDAQFHLHDHDMENSYHNVDNANNVNNADEYNADNTDIMEEKPIKKSRRKK